MLVKRPYIKRGRSIVRKELKIEKKSKLIALNELLSGAYAEKVERKKLKMIEIREFRQKENLLKLQNDER